jgi:hypothetical protein
MRVAGIFFALLAMIAGLIAAGYWDRSSRLQVIPFKAEGGDVEPADVDQKHSAWIFAQFETTREAGRLSGIAARWTAASVVLAAAASLLSSLAPN